ncbi:MAG: SURF1 family protein [Nocardioidaceae bacterium]
MLGLHAFAALVAALCLVAGLWQLGVYHDQQATSRADRSGAPAAALQSVLAPTDALPADLVGRSVAANGRYGPDAEQLLVSGRTLGARTGYWVLSPLLVDGAPAAGARPAAMLVVRGWTPTPVLPAVPSGPVRVTGSLQPGESADVGVQPGPQGARVVAAVRIPALVNVLPYQLYAGYLVRTAEQPSPSDGLATVAPPVPGASWTVGLRNLAYALQWWVFGAFALFMWWRMVTDRLSGERMAGDQPTGPPPGAATSAT